MFNNLLHKIMIVSLFVLYHETAFCSEATRPNIVFILADDMGYGDAGFNGCTDIPTPAIDSIASAGIRFNAGYVTCPQCAPSRSAILTGRDQNMITCNNNMSLNIVGLTPGPTYASRMKDAGYKTGIVGKWHLGTQEHNHPLNRGFDSFFGFLGGGSNYWPPGKSTSIPGLLEGKKPYKKFKTGGYLTDMFGDRAVDFINKNKEDPFFLFLSFNAPHTPMQAPPAAVKKFDHLKAKGKHRPCYAAMVSIMDTNIQKVLQALKDNGLDENTVVIFTSDNGGPIHHNGSSNAPLRGYKGDLLEGGVRVPFVMQWPGNIKAGQTVDAPISALDLLPTSLAMAGVAPTKEDKFDGLNLLPALLGKEKYPARTLQWYFPERYMNKDTWAWAIREGDWKMVHYTAPEIFPKRNVEVSLFNLKNDIAESKDLSSQHAKKRVDLTAKNAAWRATMPTEFSNLSKKQIDQYYDEMRARQKANQKKK